MAPIFSPNDRGVKIIPEHVDLAEMFNPEHVDPHHLNLGLKIRSLLSLSMVFGSLINFILHK